MRRAQIRHGLDAEQLRRGRKRKSESGLRDWTEAEDVQLLKVVWSGARGLDRSIPTRGYETCKKRLQLIGKHVDPQWLVLHKSDATLTYWAIPQLFQSLLTGREVRDAQRRRPLCLKGSRV